MHEYEIEEIGSDVLIVHIQPKIDFVVEIKFRMSEQIDSLVYRMVHVIGTASQEQRSGFKELSRDETFTDMVEDVYAKFEQGRSVLLGLKH